MAYSVNIGNGSLLGKDLTVVSSHLSIKELNDITEQYDYDKLLQNSLIISSPVEIVDGETVDKGNYAICASDNDGNIVPLTYSFDKSTFAFNNETNTVNLNQTYFNFFQTIKNIISYNPKSFGCDFKFETTNPTTYLYTYKTSTIEVNYYTENSVKVSFNPKLCLDFSYEGNGNFTYTGLTQFNDDIITYNFKFIPKQTDKKSLTLTVTNHSLDIKQTENIPMDFYSTSEGLNEFVIFTADVYAIKGADEASLANEIQLNLLQKSEIGQTELHVYGIPPTTTSSPSPTPTSAVNSTFSPNPTLRASAVNNLNSNDYTIYIFKRYNINQALDDLLKPLNPQKVNLPNILGLKNKGVENKGYYQINTGDNSGWGLYNDKTEYEGQQRNLMLIAPSTMRIINSKNTGEYFDKIKTISIADKKYDILAYKNSKNMYQTLVDNVLNYQVYCYSEFKKLEEL